MRREIFGVSILRWALAASGLAAGTVALAGALTQSPFVGHCLQTAAPAFGHCAWCYVAVGLLTAAATPWPRLNRIRVRT